MPNPPTKTPLELLSDQTRGTSSLSTLNPQLSTSLAAAGEALAAHLLSITSQIESFEDTLLADRLKSGLHALKAHCFFCIKDPAKQGQGRKPKTIAPTVGAISPQGFEGWLAARFHPTKHPLKSATAYRWMTALKGLGLDEHATDAQVDAQLQVIRLGNITAQLPPPTLKSLIAAATETLGPPPEPPARITQTEFEFLREGLTAFREAGEAILLLKPQLHENPDMQRVATARVYGLLYELTGTHWTPSTDPDPLAHIDPDTIEI